MGWLCRNTFNNQMPYVSALACVLERDCADIALGIHVKNGVFIQVFRLRYATVAELNVERVSVLKVADFHGLYPLSKKALCTVSPSGNRITRRYRFFISSILAHRLIRPSACMCSFSGNRTTY